MQNWNGVYNSVSVELRNFKAEIPELFCEIVAVFQRYSSHVIGNFSKKNSNLGNIQAFKYYWIEWMD